MGDEVGVGPDPMKWKLGSTVYYVRYCQQGDMGQRGMGPFYTIIECTIVGVDPIFKEYHLSIGRTAKEEQLFDDFAEAVEDGKDYCMNY